MNVAILGGGGGWHTADLTRALEQKGHRACIHPIHALTARVGELPRLAVRDTALEGFDAVLLRIIPKGSLEQIIFRVDALHCLERLGVTVLNPPGVIERTVDKFYTSALLEEAGLKTPRVVVTERLDEAMAAFQMMGDVVVKPLFGSGGRGIVRVSDPEIAYRVFHALKLERAVYYVQQAVPHDGRDLRVFVVGTRVLAAILAFGRNLAHQPGEGCARRKDGVAPGLGRTQRCCRARRWGRIRRRGSSSDRDRRAVCRGSQQHPWLARTPPRNRRRCCGGDRPASRASRSRAN